MTRQQLEGAIEALSMYLCSDLKAQELSELYEAQLSALPPEPDYRALLVEAAEELAALGKDGLIIDEDLAGDLQTFAARIRAALEATNGH